MYSFHEEIGRNLDQIDAWRGQNIPIFHALGGDMPGTSSKGDTPAATDADTQVDTLAPGADVVSGSDPPEANASTHVLQTTPRPPTALHMAAADRRG